MKRMTCLFVGVLLACGMAVQGTPRYVSLSGNSASPYTNWADAATNIQDAVNASGAGDIIYITNGTYTLTNQIQLDLAITLEGVNGSSNTFINGNYPNTVNRCFVLNNAAAVISGLTVSNGYAASGYGGGIYNNGGLIRNCIISSNVAIGEAGGVYMATPAAIITNSTITRNYASGLGGGVGGAYNVQVQLMNCTISFNSSPACGGLYLQQGLAENCVISNNSSASGSGGLYVQYTTIVRNSVIVQNTGVNGGGLRCDGSPTLENCLIMNNRATQGGGIWANFSGTVRNCTIVSNAANEGGGIYAYNLTPLYVNTIVYSNAAPAGPNWYNYVGYPIFTNSCAPGLSGSGNISGYPQFADWSNNNYRLTAHSPCVNTGANQDWMTNSVDLDGRLRIDRINGLVDMGAYELIRNITLVTAR